MSRAIAILILLPYLIYLRVKSLLLRLSSIALLGMAKVLDLIIDAIDRGRK